MRLEQKSANAACQHAYPHEPLGKSPPQGESPLRAAEAARADDLNVSGEAGEGTRTPAKLLYLFRL